MNKLFGFKLYCWYFVICCILAIVAVCSIPGCLSSHAPDSILPESPAQLLTKVVYKQNWLIPICTMGLGFSAFSFLSGKKEGMAAAIGFGTTLVLTLAITRYATLIAFGGMIGIFAMNGYAVYYKSKALKQVIQGEEKFRGGLKKSIEPDLREFETDDPTLELEVLRIANNSTQSKKTQAIVKDVKTGTVCNEN